MDKKITEFKKFQVKEAQLPDEKKYGHLQKWYLAGILQHLSISPSPSPLAAALSPGQVVEENKSILKAFQDTDRLPWDAQQVSAQVCTKLVAFNNVQRIIF